MRADYELKTFSEGTSGAQRARRWTAVAIGSLLILLLAAGVVAPKSLSAAQFGISIRIGPPPLPVYAQPICPGPGYMWTPGYWAYDPVNGYYWVPGTWVLAPAPGLLWTPGYWGWEGGGYIWHHGYWGPHVGFYGGINYGFGYVGVGYAGGYWRGGSFFYNREVNNVNVVNIHNVYRQTVVNNISVSRVSYNGGAGGLNARPTAAEMAAERDHHIESTRLQQQHQEAAHQNRAQWASVNHGRPSVVATARPGAFQRSSAARPAAAQNLGASHPNAGPGGGRRPGAPAQPADHRAMAKTAGGQPTAPRPQPRAQTGRQATKNTRGGQAHPQAQSKSGGARPQAQNRNEKPSGGEKREQQHAPERR